MQVNNMKIRRVQYVLPGWLVIHWQVVAPDKRILEEFESQDAAIAWARQVTDFLKRKEK